VVQPDIGHHNAPRHELVRQKRQAVIRPEVSELLIASLYVPRNMPGKRNPDVLEHQDVFRKAELPEDLPSGIGAQILNDFRGESFQEETDPGEPSPGPLQGLIRGGAAPQQPSDTNPGFDIVQLRWRHELSNGQCDLGPSFAGTDQDDSVVRRRQMAEAVPQHDCIFLHRAELVGFQQYGMHSRIIQEPSLPREVRPRCRVPLVRVSGNKGNQIQAQPFRDGRSPHRGPGSESSQMAVEGLLGSPVSGVRIETGHEIQRCEIGRKMAAQIPQALAIERATLPPLQRLFDHRIDIGPRTRSREVVLHVVPRNLRVNGCPYLLSGQATVNRNLGDRGTCSTHEERKKVQPTSPE